MDRVQHYDGQRLDSSGRKDGNEKATTGRKEKRRS